MMASLNKTAMKRLVFPRRLAVARATTIKLISDRTIVVVVDSL